MLLLTIPLLGCSKVPAGQASVDQVHVVGESAVSEEELKSLLATRRSSRFLGIARGVFYEHRLYNHHVLQMDLQRVERIYRAHGYYHARVKSTRVLYKNDKHVRIVIYVEEGEPTIVQDVALVGTLDLPVEHQKAFRKAVFGQVAPGKVFQEESFTEAADKGLHALRDLGYARATVTRNAQVDLPQNAAHLEFTVKPGDRCVYGEVAIDGLTDEISEKRIRRTLQIKRGDRYSQSELEEAQRELLRLGVFSSVQIKPELEALPESNKIPLTVITKPTALRTVELGGGTQLDVVRAAVHGRIGWSSKNFLGGLRRFRSHLRPGVVLYPTRLQDLQAPTDLFPFVNAEVELKQPGFMEARTDGVVGLQGDIYPVILGPQVDPDAPVLGYLEEQGNLALERTIGGHLFVSPKYTLKFAQPFTYQGELDPDLRSLTISSMEFFARFDTRDDLLFPTRGFAASTALEYAGGPLGGQVNDVLVQPEVRAYLPLAKGWTLALRTGTGLLFPQNWGEATARNGGGPAPGASRREWVRDTQIGLFRSLFAGGPNSNRGYAQRGIGPHGIIPFFVPSVQGPQVAAACENDPEADPANCLLPLGGRTRWEASIEVRFPLVDSLYGATFCDAADVAPGQLEYRFDRPHLSCGLGLRYATPVGPLRLDAGYRIPGMQTLGSDEGEGIPPTLFGVPMAIAFSIGEAF